MRRRDFVRGIAGSAIAWPLAARSQGAPTPVVGYLLQGTQDSGVALVAAVRKGLADSGLVEGKDFASELRFANHDVDTLPRLATDLVQRRVAVIVALNTTLSARAAKEVTKEIPIVFVTGTDPIKSGLVTSLNRPGGNVTGFSTMNLELGSKWVALLHELMPTIKRVAILVNFAGGDSARSVITNTQTATLAMGLQIEFVFANNESEIEAAFAGLGARAQALLVHPDALFLQNRAKVAALAIREKMPALSTVPDFAKAGGFMSYGSSFIDAHRQAGIYVGRILRGDRPSELPVQQASKFDFVINLKTAKTLGVNIPATLLARADEVIE